MDLIIPYMNNRVFQLMHNPLPPVGARQGLCSLLIKPQ